MLEPTEMEEAPRVVLQRQRQRQKQTEGRQAKTELVNGVVGVPRSTPWAQGPEAEQSEQRAETDAPPAASVSEKKRSGTVFPWDIRSATHDA